MFDGASNGETMMDIAAFFAQPGRGGTKALSVASLLRPVTRTGETTRTMIAPAHEFFIQDMDGSAKEVTINKATLGNGPLPPPSHYIHETALFPRHCVDFGFTPFLSSSTPKIVTIYNRANAKVVVDWQIPFAHGITEQQIQSLTAESDREKDIITEGACEGMDECVRVRVWLCECEKVRESE